MSGDPIDLDAIEARANAVDEGPGDYDVRDILALVAEVRRLRDLVPELEPGRWWRVTEPDGSIWCETSRESEAREAKKKRHTLWNLHRAEVIEWREVP